MEVRMPCGHGKLSLKVMEFEITLIKRGRTYSSLAKEDVVSADFN